MRVVEKTWTNMKSLIDKRNLSYQYEEFTMGVNTSYRIWANDGPLTYECTIIKESPANAEQTDFETKYKNVDQKKLIKSFYLDADTKEHFSDAIIPNGETWFIDTFSASGVGTTDAYVMLVEDYRGANEEILALCRGEVDGRPIQREITGDGTKRLAIVVVNNLMTKAHMGGEYSYFKKVKV